MNICVSRMRHLTVGGSWAFAGASAASDRMCISTNASIVVPLSAEDICFCSSDDGCQGGQIDTPWEYISQSGAVSGAQQKNTAKVADPDPFADAGFCSAFSLPHCHHHGPQVRLHSLTLLLLLSPDPLSLSHSQRRGIAIDN